MAATHDLGLPPEHRARAIQAYAHDTTARRRLVGCHLGLVGARAPERRERGVRRSGGRVLANTNPRREEARYEVVAARGRATRHHDATGVYPLEAGPDPPGGGGGGACPRLGRGRAGGAAPPPCRCRPPAAAPR